MKHLTPIALLLLAATPMAWAQDEAPLYMGAHVRVVTQPAHGRLEGDVYSWDDATLVLRTGQGRDGEPRLSSIPKRDIDRVELRIGRSARGKGALIGILPGLALIGVGVAMGRTYACDYCDIPEGAVVGGLGILALPVGAAIGAAVSHGDVWEKVAPQPSAARGVQVGLTMGPNRKGVGLAVSIPIGGRR